jgi:molybdenum cofactor cytidylyltransferase
MVEHQIGAIVLAAGNASRFGRDKLMAIYKGTPLIHFAVRAASLSFADPITLVIASDKLDTYQPHIAGLSKAIHVTVAELASDGLAYSLTAGLDSMPDGVAGVVVLLADMPLVDARLINTLVNAYASSDYAVVPQHNGAWGNPVLLSRAALVDAKNLSGDKGAKSLVRANAHRVRRVTCDRRCLVDIDTEQALIELNHAAQDVEHGHAETSNYGRRSGTYSGSY